MPTIQGVGPDDRSIGLKCDARGRLLVVFGWGPLAWISVIAHAVELVIIASLIMRL